MFSSTGLACAEVQKAVECFPAALRVLMCVQRDEPPPACCARSSAACLRAELGIW